MFSLESFYTIISKNLLEPLKISSYYFRTFGSTDLKDLEVNCMFSEGGHMLDDYNFTVFYDQEPITQFNVNPEYSRDIWIQYAECYCKIKYFNPILKIFANSEHSQEKQELMKTIDFYDWYYFFHGFAALDWYRNLKYLPPNNRFSKVFICFNNLISDKRNYRLNLLARIMQKKLEDFGYISLNPDNLKEKLKKELAPSNTLLSAESKKLIYYNLFVNTPKLIIDTEEFVGTLSAFNNLDVLSKGLFHIVTETVYYDNKLHLTEKIFKPIVARRPFILVGAPGNLAYLKSYGFKTFDRWIDETYDCELDHDLRIIKIVNEIEKLCQLTPDELDTMWKEIQVITEYNFQHFYTQFKEIIVDELVDNFQQVLIKFTAGKDNSFPNYVNYKNIDFDQVRSVLKK